MSYGALALMLLNALHDHLALRLLVAVATSGYALAESSVTTSHRDYAMVYIMWAVALLPAHYAEGVAFGVCVHFIASSGFAKLYVGGQEWLQPCTMRNYLMAYGELDFKSGGPGSPWMNKLVCRYDVLSGGASAFTILFECFIVPASLAMPPGACRLAICVTMVGLHVGILLVQSGVIGVFFIPNIACYLLGFGAPLELFSPGWYCAVVVVIMSIGSVLGRGRLLPEDWPLTPFALFAWSGSQWQILRKTFEIGKTRLVLTAGDVSSNIIGASIEGKAMRSATASSSSRVFNAWNSCIADTTLHGDVLNALDFEAMGKATWEPSDFVCKIQAWLQRTQRLIELRTGHALVRAYLVKLTDDGKVGAIIAKGPS